MKTKTILLKKALSVSLCIGVVIGTLSSCKDKSLTSTSSQDLTQYVDPYIGTGDHGHVFLGANVPFGMVQLGPNNIHKGWDWCSGYHHSDSIVIGFAHTHLSGTGCTDLGDIMFMPYTGEITSKRGEQNNIEGSYASFYKHENETVRPGYYSLAMENGVKVELTATERVGFHKYTFPQTEKASHIMINLKEGNGDESIDTYIKLVDEHTIEGYRISKGWSPHQEVYFTMKSNQAITKISVFDDDIAMEGNELKTKGVKGVLSFEKPLGEIMLKVGISSVSCANALKNMEAEVSDWNFDQVATTATQKWNDELSRITIKSNSDVTKKVFYTSLYHTMIAPSLYSDVDGTYRGSDNKIHEGGSKKTYTTFSLWDVYRANFPMMMITQPDKMSDMVNSMLDIYKQQGKLPVWHFWGGETDCMVGNPAIPIVADAVLKGFSGFDKELAYEAMKNSAMLDERGLKEYKEYGYVPYDLVNESVAKGMEYALADWSLAQVAKQEGKTEDYEYFLKRSNTFAAYFDKNINFVKGKDSKGNFRSDKLDPFKSVHRDNDYTEGNAWQYTWLAPQNVQGLVDLFGSEESFVQKLDSLFTVDGDMGEHASPDISGLIGQYAHGNEPSHHVVYLYPFVGQPWKTAEKVRETLTQLYHDAPAGVCGNEDVGQMSSWYILSALGFYQVAPAGGIYVFGSPIVDEAIINVGNGKSFKVIASNNSDKNMYIQSAILNGQTYTKSFIDYKDIMAGGELVFEMGSAPSATFGVEPADRPQTIQ